MISTELIALGLLLTSALMRSFFSMYVKISLDRLVFYACMGFVSLITGIVLFPFISWMNYPAVGCLLLSSLFFHLSIIFISRAYTHADLSKAAPLMSMFSCLTVTSCAIVIMDERLTFLSGVAILFLCGAFLIQNQFKEFFNKSDIKGIIFCILGGVFGGLQFSADFWGIKLSGDPLSYIVWTLFIAVPVLIYAIFIKKKAFVYALKNEFKLISISGVLDILSYSILIYVVYFLGAVYVLPASNVGIVITTLIGIFILKESYGVRRILAAVLVTVSITLMQIGT